MVVLAEAHTGEPSLPRYRQSPRRIDGDATPHSFSAAENYYRSIFFSVHWI